MSQLFFFLKIINLFTLARVLKKSRRDSLPLPPPPRVTWQDVEGEHDVGDGDAGEEGHPGPEEEVEALPAPEAPPQVPEEHRDVAELLGEGTGLA